MPRRPRIHVDTCCKGCMPLILREGDAIQPAAAMLEATRKTMWCGSSLKN